MDERSWLTNFMFHGLTANLVSWLTLLICEVPQFLQPRQHIWTKRDSRASFRILSPVWIYQNLLIRRSYQEEYLRKWVLPDPLDWIFLDCRLRHCWYLIHCNDELRLNTALVVIIEPTTLLETTKKPNKKVETEFIAVSLRFELWAWVQ